MVEFFPLCNKNLIGYVFVILKKSTPTSYWPKEKVKLFFLQGAHIAHIDVSAPSLDCYGKEKHECMYVCV